MDHDVTDASDSLTGAAHGHAENKIPLAHVALIPLPVNSMRTLPAKPAVSRVVTVTGENAADVLLQHNYWAGERIVDIAIALHFEPGAVSEPTDISMSLHLHTFAVEFSPGIDRFLSDPVLSASARGLDLSAVPDGAVLHLYCIDDAVCEVIPSHPIAFDKAAGTLTLTNAVIPHFSLYGFGFLR